MSAGDTMYYPRGLTDLDYYVLKFIANSRRYYANANSHSKSFEINRAE